MDTAHYWGLTPSQYFECNKEDRVLMQAYMETVKDMEAVEYYDSEHKSEKA